MKINIDFLKKYLKIDLLERKKENFLGIDIGASSIKLVQLKKKKGVVVLETYGELSLGPYTDLEIGRATNLSTENISKALKELLKESGADSKVCGISIPLKSSMIFTFELPAVDEKQLEKMVPLEARKYIPVPISEVTLDWRVIPEEQSPAFNFEDSYNEKTTNEGNTKKGKVKVLVAAIHKSAIRTYEEIAKNVGLELKFLEIEIFSTIRAVLNQDISALAILDIGAGKSKFYIVEYGIVRDSHIINRGSQDLTRALSQSEDISFIEAEKIKRDVGLLKSLTDKSTGKSPSLNLDLIFSEANRAIHAYQKKYNKNISKVILTGGGVVINGMMDYAVKNLETEVIIADPFDKVETPAFLADVLKDVGPEFAVALGLTLRGLQKVS
jgi:type IV pilus assembly protein PilM